MVHVYLDALSEDIDRAGSDLTVGGIVIFIRKVVEQDILIVDHLASLSSREVTLGATNSKCGKTKPLERAKGESLRGMERARIHSVEY